MRVVQFGTEEQKTSKSGAYIASIHFLPSDVERMVDGGGLGTLCLASGKAPDPSPPHPPYRPHPLPSRPPPLGPPPPPPETWPVLPSGGRASFPAGGRASFSLLAAPRFVCLPPTEKTRTALGHHATDGSER
jgi:hypothetical protein